MKIKKVYTEIELGKPEKIWMFWVEDENGREVFGPVENPQICENYIKENK